jgi:hypothetical protein
MKPIDDLDIAEQILQGMSGGKAIKSSTQANRDDGIKSIKITDSIAESFIRSIVPEDKPTVTPEPIVEDAVSISETKISNLISKLNSLLQEAKTVITELTTVGMIGTNQKFVLNKKKTKNEPNKTNKRN